MNNQKAKNKKQKTTFTQLINAKKAYEKAEKTCSELKQKYNQIVCDSVHLSNKICSIGRKKYYVRISDRGICFKQPEISFLPVNE